MKLEELRKAAETLKAAGEHELQDHLLLWPDGMVAFPDLPGASCDDLARAFSLAANALPKLLAVAEAAGGSTPGTIADVLDAAALTLAGQTAGLSRSVRASFPDPCWFRKVAAALRALEAKENADAR